jgi:hypothetical protein
MDQNIGLQSCRRLPLNPQMLTEIELEASEETNKMTNKKSENDHAPTSVKHKALHKMWYHVNHNLVLPELEMCQTCCHDLRLQHVSSLRKQSLEGERQRYNKALIN